MLIFLWVSYIKYFLGMSDMPDILGCKQQMLGPSLCSKKS